MHKLNHATLMHARTRHQRGHRALPVGLLAVLAVAMGLAGCVESLPTAALPDLAKDPRKLLSKEEQQQAIDELSQKKAAQETEAEKKVEKSN